jgi:DNA-binding response OmpR family regulator
MSSGERLLLVEDDEANCLTLTALLEDEGYIVDTARSFSEASARIEKNPSCDVVLLDQRLGDGHGSELVTRIRTVWPSARIVSLSGGDESVEHVRFDGVVAKGDDLSILLQLLHR